MKPRRTIHSNAVFHLPGGNEDNDLWAMRHTDSDGDPIIRTTWVPSDEEREAIAKGENIEVIIWGQSHPAITVQTDDTPLGRPRPADQEGSAQ